MKYLEVHGFVTESDPFLHLKPLSGKFAEDEVRSPLDIPTTENVVFLRLLRQVTPRPGGQCYHVLATT